MHFPRLIFCSAFLLAACQSVQVEVPPVEQKARVEIDNPESLAAIQFDRVGIKIRRGTIIGSYEPSILGLSGCLNIDHNIFWNQGRVLSRNVEFGDIFFHSMRDANFNVIGDPDQMFAGNADRRRRPEFLVGGQLEEIRLNVCEEMDMWTGGSRGTQRGKGSVKIRWQVFSQFERKVVYETETEGSANVTNGMAGGEIVIVQDAFASAVDNLAAEQAFVDILTNYQPNVEQVKGLDATTLVLKRTPVHQKGITETIDSTRLAVVTIDTGTGHGSGFFITPRYILTNYHVVGEAKFIRVQLLTGRQLVGEVIRRLPGRDIALVQVEPTAVSPIPIRETPVKITEEVFAVGSPLDKALSGTVTKGIVSKFLVNARGQEDIQADVDIQGGNSGGPLFDKNGNIVGVSYAGIGPPGKFSAGVNFFIPINDALHRLKIELVDQLNGS